MKRGGPLKRKTPLRRSTLDAHEQAHEALRRAPLPRVNKARAANRKADAFGPQSELCRATPCLACGLPPTDDRPSDPAHVRSRGAGGLDRGNVVPLCRSCHQAQHALGWGEFLSRAGLTRRHLELALERLEQAAYPTEGPQ